MTEAGTEVAAPAMSEAGTEVAAPALSEAALALARRIIAKYPNPRSALVSLLYLVQSEWGWVPRGGMRQVAELLGITTAEVEAVATFYTMLKLDPCGRYVLSICTNPSCSLLGGRGLLDHALGALGVRAHQVSEDGLFSVEEEECLAACDKAPVLTVNYVYYDRVTPERLDEMIEAIRRGETPPASRGGVPGDLREISRVLAGAQGRLPQQGPPHPPAAPIDQTGPTEGGLGRA